MTRGRLDMAQEGQLWEMALEHLGSDGLLQAVIEMWGRAACSSRPVVEHLSHDKVSQEVLNILKVAQERVGAFVPGRRRAAGTVTLYARHASSLVDGLIHGCRKSSFREPWGAIVLKSNWEFDVQASSPTMLVSNNPNRICRAEQRPFEILYEP